MQGAVLTAVLAAGAALTAQSDAASGRMRAATQRFQSRPDLRPPVIRLTATGDPKAGDVFLDAQAAPQPGAIILDSRGRLVWFHPAPRGQSVTDLRVQTYRGQRVLTFWQGKIEHGHGIGEDVILNSSYRRIATVRAGNRYDADLHEFVLTSQGTALITAYAQARADLRSVGGQRNGTVLDSIAQEVDVRTGKVLWQWRALGHVPLSLSHAGRPVAGRPYDFFHINSVQELPSRNFLISSRNTWAVYYVQRSTGKVVWELGGKGSSFTMGPHTQFEWQHDARLNRDGTLTLFDDAAAPAVERQSRAVVLRLDTKNMRATIAHRYFHRPSTLARSQGNVQRLADGNLFVGWGDTPWFSEYTPGGRQIFDGRMAAPAQSYRAFRYPWAGTPTTRPALAVRSATNGAITVYASWNGDTRVAAWQVLAGPTPTALSMVTRAPRTGFETAIATSTSQRYVAVQALDSRGNVLASSRAVTR